MSTDVARLVSDNFDLWTSAIERKTGVGRGRVKKVSLYGIERLRALILELAVRGKLTRQDIRDEPAAAVLERVQRQKSAAAADGTIRNPKNPHPIDPDNVPFSLPSSWQWARLGAVCLKITDGTHHSPKNTLTGDFKYISAKNIKPWGIDETEITYVSSRDHEAIFARCDPEPGDILYIKDGATTGVATINSLSEPFSMLSSVALLKPGNGVLNQYVLRCMTAPSFYNQMRSEMKGVAITRVTLQKLGNALIPLPPLAEQRRIVDRVDELMALCDAMEAQGASALDAHQTLVETLLATLVNAADADALSVQWARLETHFDTLFTTQISIERLRLTILDLAVRGRLSRQSDWPSGPVKLGSVAGLQNGYAFKSEWFSDVGIRLLRNINIGHDKIDWSELACLSTEMAQEYSRFQLSDGDVVLTLDRPFISTGTKVARIRETDLPALLLQRVARFVLSDRVLPEFIYLWVCSPLFSGQIDPGRSNGVPHISTKQVEGAAIFVPGVAEQRRIVARVDELMALCDALKTRVADKDQTRRRLANAVVERAVA